jgi:uncharacterized membrane protein YbhN (UPF0104 family)
LADVSLPLRSVAAGFAYAVANWLLQGAGVVLAARSLGIAVGSVWLLLGGAFAVAWAVGFMAIPFPGGLGVRETILLLLLNTSPSFEARGALAFAIAVRLLTIVVEGALAAIAFAAPSRRAPAEADA